ncbi:MAG: bifunctional PIG-L family deacetylase/class I SAM-dependent methyltransferase [Ornithinimicrobium sp.]
MSASTVGFDPRQPGTSEEHWWSAPQWADVPVLNMAALAAMFQSVLVVSAHPDDETLGAGGLLADLADAGMDITVLIATSGEKSHQVADESAASQLGTRRRREVEIAISALAPNAHMVHLGLPDTALHTHRARLIEAVTDRVNASTLVIAPWTRDGHSDHDAIGEACAAAASSASASVVHYPLWFWHWAEPEALPWSQVVSAEMSLVGCWRKRAALDAFVSQTRGWDQMPGGADTPPVVGPAVLRRARRLIEALIDTEGVLPRLSIVELERRSASRQATFDEMYDGDDDPWGWNGSFYEERRRALVVAMLGRQRYGRALELGCANGHLTAALEQRCDDVYALDTSAQAVRAASATAPNAHIVHGTLAADIPHGTFDLIVISEVGYFLTAKELIATVQAAKSSLADGGELLMCHWQHPTLDIPLDGVLVHEQAEALMGRSPSASYHDEDVSILLWSSSSSVAEREGRR